MNMKVLDHLIADSILEPSIIPSMENGSFSRVVQSCQFEPSLKSKLLAIGCRDFHQFITEAIELISDHEAPEVRFLFPSAVEGIELHEKILAVPAVA